MRQLKEDVSMTLTWWIGSGHQCRCTRFLGKHPGQGSHCERHLFGCRFASPDKFREKRSSRALSDLFP